MAWNLESQDDVGWPLSHLFGSNRWTPGATEGVTVAGGNGQGLTRGSQMRLHEHGRNGLLSFGVMPQSVDI